MVQDYQEKLKESIERSQAAVCQTSKWINGIIKHRQKNIDNNNATNSTNGTAQELKSASTVIGAHRAGFFQQDSNNKDENLGVINVGINKAEGILKETSAQMNNTLGKDQELTSTPTKGLGSTATTGNQ